jgi:hypothetical protein
MPHPAVTLAIGHFIQSAANFGSYLRDNIENDGKDVMVPADAMVGFMMMLDFVHSSPKGIVVNEQAQAMGMKPIIFDLELVPLLLEYIASQTSMDCDCPVCTAHKQAGIEAAADAVQGTTVVGPLPADITAALSTKH